MPRLLNKLKEKLTTRAPNKDKQVQDPIQPDPPPVPNGSTAVPMHPANTEPAIEPKPLQGRLWNEAYELLKLSNAELVEAYERILSRELLHNQGCVSKPVSLENRIYAAYGGRWKQMHTIVDAALKRQEERVAKQQKIGGGLAVVTSAMRQAVRAVPEAAVAWTGVCFAFEMASNSFQEAKANHQGIIYVVSRMDWYWHLAELLLDGNESESAPSALRSEMEKHIIDLYRKLLLFQMKSVCRYHRQHRPTLWRDAIKADDWADQLDDIRNAEAAVQEDSRVFNALTVQRRLSEIDRGSRVLHNEIQDILPKIQEHFLGEKAKKCLKDLRVTDPRDDKSRIEDTNGGLLQDAYGWAIRHTDFIAWRDEKENHLLWIKGDPGKGKTMLMCGIIDELQSCDISPCYFFCQATDPRLNNATAVLRGLIYLLVDTNRQLLPHIQEKYDQAGEALFQDANSWVVLSQMFAKLLEDPSLDGQVFMIDALDECQKDLERLLDLIVGTPAKWVVSSRNWTAIEAKMGAVSQNIRFSLELNEQSVSEAVRFFVSHKAAQLKTEKGLDEETEQKVRTYLTDNARGTFLWVALVCKELLKLGVRKRHLLKKMAEFPSHLRPLYERMMQQIRESEDSDLCEKILRLVAVVYRPVTLAELASLLDMEDAFSGDELEEIVAACGSFLVVRDNVVRFVHQSAQDFLLRDKMFAPRVGSQHYAVFSRSLQILSTTLRRDMYNLRHPGALIEEYAPSQDQDVLRHARYSCIYWINHLKAVNDLNREKCVLSLQDDGVVHRFFNNKLLNWLEACSLIRSIPDAARTVRILRSLAPVHDCTMRNLIEDVYRFVLYHKVGIGLAPLQVYCSALIFSPKSSLVRLLYEDIEVPKWVVKKPDMPSRWTARLHFLEGHTDPVNAVTFSPDGTQLASGSGEGIAKIWDTETGTCLHTFTCLTSVRQVAFSPDGKYLAAGSWRGVEVWDAMSSTSIYTFYDDCDFVNITFSPDSARLAAVVNSFKTETERFVRTWDLGTGMEVKTHSLHQHECKATAFAPDGTHLASVADQNGMLSIWNMTTNRHLFVGKSCADGRETWFWDARFSLDASRLAVAMAGCIYIFEASTGECLQELHDDSWSFGFLADSQTLMSVSEDASFRIWDTTTGTCLLQLSGGGRPGIRLYVAVPSPDGMFIAETKEGRYLAQNIELWDLATTLLNSTAEEPTEALTAIAFSPDGAQLATASISETEGKIIRIRDSLTSACLTDFPWSGTSIISLAFFPDGKRLASGGKDRIGIWDIATGLNVQTIGLETLQINWLHSAIRFSASPIAVSSNGDLVAAIFGRDPHVVMWDLTSGAISKQFYVGKDILADWPVAAVFSPDDTKLGLLSGLGTISICDINTGDIIFKHLFEPLDISQPCPLQLRNELQHLIGQGEGSDQSLKQAQPRIFDMSGFNVSRDRTWMLKRQQRVLWLPPDYRPIKIVSRDGSVVIQSREDGPVHLFRFAVDELDALLA